MACGNEDDVGLSSAARFGAHAYVILCVSSCARGDIVLACFCVRGCARACVTRYVACGLGVHGCASCLLTTACVSSVCRTATFALRSGHGDGRKHAQEMLGMIRICCAKRCR